MTLSTKQDIFTCFKCIVVIALLTSLSVAAGACGNESDEFSEGQQQEVKERIPEANVSSHGVKLGMQRNAVNAQLMKSQPESIILDEVHLINQSRIAYGNPSKPESKVIVHYEDWKVVEIFYPAKGERFPPQPKPKYKIHAGMTRNNCDAVFRETPDISFCMSKGLDSDGCEVLIYANPQDAKSVIVLTMKDNRLVDAHWFGTGESLLSCK